MGFVGLVGSERNERQVARGIHRGSEQFDERPPGDRPLVAGNGQPSFADVKRSDRRTAIRPRIVQHSISETVRMEQFIFEFVAVWREREFARQPMLIEDHRPTRNPQGFVELQIGEVLIQVVFDPLVDRTAMVVEQADFFPKIVLQARRQGNQFGPSGRLNSGQPIGRQLQIDVPEQLHSLATLDLGIVSPKSQGEFHV